MKFVSLVYSLSQVKHLVLEVFARLPTSTHTTLTQQYTVVPTLFQHCINVVRPKGTCCNVALAKAQAQLLFYTLCNVI